MKLQYFGTAAAEGIPALFCDCALCRRAKEQKGKDVRTRSQAMVDDCLLIDFPADTYLHTLYQGLNLSHVHSCLVTHSHSDHLYPADLEMRGEVFAHLEDASPLTFYCSPRTSEGIRSAMDAFGLERQRRVLLEVLEPYRPYTIEGYTVTALEANHDSSTDPYIYRIAGADGRALLYANDTGYFPDAAWGWLERERPRLDFVSLDCTGMNLKGWADGHMSLDTNLRVRERLTTLGCAGPHTRWCIHHFSHNGGLTHAELAGLAAEHGMLASYDGMTVEF